MSHGDEPIRGCCVRLRCKAMFIRSDTRPGKLPDGNAMSYWCWHTSDDLGPDRDVASPAKCQAGRECFETPD
ncbi:hypothetical protein KQI84_07805 [bacterium]|nr:hypothetical protein [bacterium]